MHFSIRLAAAFLSIAPLVMAADPAPASWTVQNDKQKTEYEAYTSHVVSLAAYTTATSVLHTATYSVDAEPVSILQAAATATTPVTVPSVATPAPTDVQAFLQSVLQHEVSLLQYDRTATATATYNAAVKPTGVVMAAGAAAVGVLGLAML